MSNLFRWERKHSALDTASAVVASDPKVAAGVAAGAVGLVAMGPITGVIAGAGVAMAYDRNDEIGGLARKVGRTGAQVTAHLRTLDKQYHYRSKIEAEAKRTVNEVSRWEKKNHASSFVFDKMATVDTSWLAKKGRKLFGVAIGGSKKKKNGHHHSHSRHK